MTSPSHDIHTVLRLADNSTVPIVIRPTPHGWMRAVTIDGEPIKRCKRGHVLIGDTRYLRKDGYYRCKVCVRICLKRWYKKHADEHRANCKRRRNGNGSK
jgi:phosphoketolase